MTIKVNAQGAERKRLVKAVSDWLGVRAKYLGAPTFSYSVGDFTIEKDGSLSYDDRACGKAVENLLKHISDEGFVVERSQAENTALTVSVPADKVSVEKLTSILAAKGKLIKKALGIDALPVDVGKDSISFPWFSEETDSNSLEAYTAFISAICKMSREQKRVTAREKEVENEKYAFRCFLLRLGFIGDEYKAARKILLKNLSGSSAFRNGGSHEISE